MAVAGSLRVLNGHHGGNRVGSLGREVNGDAGVVGEEKFVIKPAQHLIMTPKIPKGEHTVHTSLYFRKGDEARPFFSSEWRISDDARNLVFFYQDPQTTHIRLHTIKDYIP